MHIIKTTGISMSFCLGMAWAGSTWAANLPADIQWNTNDDAPVFANQNAPKGGKYTTWIQSFPLTLRVEGPDSNGSFAGFTRPVPIGLLEVHPNTRDFIPSLAVAWAFDENHKTAYFKLDPDATWSDGEKVTADDWTYMFQFMRSKEIQAPWYNNFYTSEVTDISKIDEHTISITIGSEKAPEDILYMLYDLVPKPEHFLKDKVDDNWVRKHNWTIVPSITPYVISDVKKGKYITFKRNKDWWGKDKRYYKGRYNVDKIQVKVIRDPEVAFQTFLKGDLDAFNLTLPDFWHVKAQGEPFDKGYIHKLWAYMDRPQGAAGIWLNQGMDFLKDRNMRLGIAHALDIDKMIATALRGDYIRLESTGAGHGDYTNPNVKPFPFNPEKAMEYFAMAGYKDMGPRGYLVNAAGEDLTLSLNYSSITHSDRLTVLKEEAKKAGLNVLLNLVEGANGFKAALEKQHQAAFIHMNTSYVPQYWEYWHSDNANKPQTNNFTNSAHPELDRLVTIFNTEFDKAKRVEAAWKLQETVINEAAYIPFYKIPYVRSAYWRWLQLPTPPATALTKELFSDGEWDLGLFWIDEQMEEETRKAMKSGKTFEPVTRTDTTYKK